MFFQKLRWFLVFVVFYLTTSLPPDDEKLYPRSGNLSVSVGSLLDDQGWHSVLMERINTHVNLTVDRLTYHFSTTGVANSLEVDYEVGLLLYTSSSFPRILPEKKKKHIMNQLVVESDTAAHNLLYLFLSQSSALEVFPCPENQEPSSEKTSMAVLRTSSTMESI